MSYIKDLTASSSSVNEGQTVNFTFTYVSSVSPTPSPIVNTSLPYTLSGSINAADILGGALSGNVTTNSSGVGTISVTLLNDMVTEGTETLTVNVTNPMMGNINSASTFVNDTSISGFIPQTYSLVANQSNVNEGSTATFTLTTTNVASGTSIAYTLTGNISAADISSGSLSGNAIVNANGVTTISIPIAADKQTEGPETLNLNIQGRTASVTINDTSTYVNPNDHITLVEGFGQIRLYQNSDGSQSVLENGVYYPIKNTPYGGDPNGPQSGFIAADFYNGVRVVVYQGGAFWYMNSSWAKDMTGPNSQDTGQVNSSQVTPLFLSNNATPSYALSSPRSVN